MRPDSGRSDNYLPNYNVNEKSAFYIHLTTRYIGLYEVKVIKQLVCSLYKNLSVVDMD